MNQGAYTEKIARVALAYDRELLAPAGPAHSYNVHNRYSTRDVLEVLFATSSGTRLMVIHNHWPSRMLRQPLRHLASLARQSGRKAARDLDLLVLLSTAVSYGAGSATVRADAAHLSNDDARRDGSSAPRDRQDGPHVSHGVVEPDVSMPLAEYERKLAETQEQWLVDER